MDHQTLSIETFIRWNSPPIHRADKLLQQTFEHYLSKGHWTPITKQSKYFVSKVVDQQRNEESKFKFLE